MKPTMVALNRLAVPSRRGRLISDRQRTARTQKPKMVSTITATNPR